MNARGQVPFLRLLIPIILGILYVNFKQYSSSLLFVGILGVALVLFSFFQSSKTSYSLRWMFGAGLMLFLFFFSAQYFQYYKEFSSYNFPQTEYSYIGELLDFPQQKKRSVVCEVELTYPENKKALLYLEPDDRSQMLSPGDIVVFQALMRPFKNLGNPGEFDYKRFMEQKGFSGSAYVRSAKWINTGKTNRTIKSEALRVRSRVLDLYKSFDLNKEEYAFLSALTLGYKTDLSDELKQAFRSSGTSHVLAVSGLHVAVIFIVIVSVFSFIQNRGRWFIFKQILVLLILWTYVFVTGMPVSVMRASIMLTMFCIGSLFHRKGYHYNTLVVAAFFILIVNPYYLFDVGFQLSFTAVFSILFFQPKLSQLYKPKCKFPKYVWDLMIVSTSAQLGVFPLGLYYFGTFPTYFFVTNLLVIPLVGLTVYLTVVLSFVTLFTASNLSFVLFLHKVIEVFLKFIIRVVLQIVYLFEKLPLAAFDNCFINISQLFLIFAALFSLTFFILRKRANMFILFLSSIALLLAINTHSQLNKTIDQFVIYNSYTEPEMGYRINDKKVALQELSNRVIAHPTASVILLTENFYKSKTSDEVLPVDYLILSGDNSFSMTELNLFFKPRMVIIDSSISYYTAERIKKECVNIDVAIHDIFDSGAYSINF